MWGDLNFVFRNDEVFFVVMMRFMFFVVIDAIIHSTVYSTSFVLGFLIFEKLPVVNCWSIFVLMCDVNTSFSSQ